MCVVAGGLRAGGWARRGRSECVGGVSAWENDREGVPLSSLYLSPLRYSLSLSLEFMAEPWVLHVLLKLYLSPAPGLEPTG